MDINSSHPITTPKGANLLTVVLTVVGFFIPFFTGLEAAQIVAGLAAIIIAWLYWAEAMDVLNRRVGLKRLALPTLAILIILGVAAIATIKVSSRARPPAALTIGDVSDAVDKAMSKSKSDNPETVVQTVPVDRNVTYRTVIEEPMQIERPNVLPPKIISANDALSDDLRRRINRMRAGSAEENECNQKVSGIRLGLFGLIAKATRIQNSYGYGQDDKKMVSDLAAWLVEVESFFEKNKTNSLDFNKIKQANYIGKTRTFLGIHDSGYKAWASMDTKRETLEAMQSALGNDSCDQIKKDAEADCAAKGAC